MTLLSEFCRRNGVEPKFKNDVDVETYLAARHIAQDKQRLQVQLAALHNSRSYSPHLVRGYSKVDVSKPFGPNLSFDYDENEYVADIVCPITPGNIVREYPKFSRRDKNAVANIEIGSDQEIPETGVSFTTLTYREKPYGNKQKVDLNKVAQTGLPLMEMHSTALRRYILNSRELRVANLLMSSATYAGSGLTTALSGNNRWDVAAGTSTADPLKDIRVAKWALASRANMAVASTPVLDTLRSHPKVIALAGPSVKDRLVSLEELAEVIGVDMIVEASAKYDGSGNAATATYPWMWGKGFWLGRCQPASAEHIPCFCRTFRHTDIGYREEIDNTKGVRGITWLMATHEDAEVVAMDDMGYLIDTVIS